jgi:hypothetical protein
MTGKALPGLHLRNGEFVVQHDRATLKKCLVLKNAGLWCFLVNCQVGNRKIRQIRQ